MAKFRRWRKLFIWVIILSLAGLAIWILRRYAHQTAEGRIISTTPQQPVVTASPPAVAKHDFKGHFIGLSYPANYSEGRPTTSDNVNGDNLYLIRTLDDHYYHLAIMAIHYTGALTEFSGLHARMTDQTYTIAKHDTSGATGYLASKQTDYYERTYFALRASTLVSISLSTGDSDLSASNQQVDDLIASLHWLTQ